MARETKLLVQAPRRRAFQPRYGTRPTPRSRSRSRCTAPLECCGPALSWQQAPGYARMAAGAPAVKAAGGASDLRPAGSPEEFRISDQAPWRAAASVLDVGGVFRPRVRRLCARAPATQGCVGVAEGHHGREDDRGWHAREWRWVPEKLRPDRRTPRHHASSAAGTPWARAPCWPPFLPFPPNNVSQKIYIKVFRSSEAQNSRRNSPLAFWVTPVVATGDHDAAMPVA
jgi:hypothetical protein